MAASCNLLDVEPPELLFAFVLDKQISCPLRLSNRTDSTVAFKVKTTNPRKYCVRPNNGVVPPRSSYTVLVTMQAQTVAPPDLQCKDKFLVQSVVVGHDLSAKDITSQMFTKQGGNAVEEVKLKVTYVMPPGSPSEIAEERDGPERNFMPMQRIVDNERNPSEMSSGSMSLRSAEFGTESGSPVGRIVKIEEFMKATGPAALLVAKLTEEKNSALEQNRKLREELILARREVNKQKEGFSLILVLVVGFLSIILGYILKK